MKKVVFIFFLLFGCVSLHAQDSLSIQSRFDSLQSVRHLRSLKKETVGAKKIRMPIWSFHDQNTTINGLSLGFARITSYNNVTSNGLRVEAIGSGLLYLPFGFYPYFVKPEEYFSNKEGHIEEIYKGAFDIANGFSVSLFGTISCNTISNGLLVGGLVNDIHKANGISFAGMFNSAHKKNGLQMAGLWTSGYYMNGMQVAALGNWGQEVNGLQISAWNRANRSIKGFQLGGYNQAQTVHGLQIGIYNNAKWLKGIQIGLWNRNSKRSLPFFNWGF